MEVKLNGMGQNGYKICGNR